MLQTLNKINASALKFNIEMASVTEDICQPLFNSFGISNFGFVKLFNDGTMLRISADKEWSCKYFEHQFYNDACFYNFNDFPENSTEVRIITNHPEIDHYKALYEHNIWNIFTFSERKADHAEVSFFASTRENTEIINFYANHQDILKSFIAYFKKAAQPILTHINPTMLISTELKLQQCKREENDKINEFLKQICSHYDQTKLLWTTREADCIKQLILGKSAKETAAELHISHRTVEAHFNNIKRKAGCKKLSQLIRLVLEQNN